MKERTKYGREQIIMHSFRFTRLLTEGLPSGMMTSDDHVCSLSKLMIRLCDVNDSGSLITLSLRLEASLDVDGSSKSMGTAGCTAKEV